MSDSTPRLSLPMIQPAQAQKHVTHNEAINRLDLLVQLTVESANLVSPPVVSASNLVFIVGADAIGDWAGQDGKLAISVDGGWEFVTPNIGWRAMDRSTGTMIWKSPTAWVPLTPTELSNLDLFGLGTTASPTQPFTALLNSALWNAKTQIDGGTGSLELVFSRETDGDECNLSFKTDSQTAAILGLRGADELRLSTSPDGTNFVDAIKIDRTSGAVQQPGLPRFKAIAGSDQFLAADTWTTLALNQQTINPHGYFDMGTYRFTAPVSGTYHFGGSILYKRDVDIPFISLRMVKNQSQIIDGTYGEAGGNHQNGRTNQTSTTILELSVGDTVELQGFSRLASSYAKAADTAFWGYLIG